MSESVCIVNGNVEGQENESAQGGPPKAAKQLEKEAKKLAKLEKYKQKKDKLKETPVHTMEKVEVCSTITRKQNCTIWYRERWELSGFRRGVFGGLGVRSRW